MELPKKYIYQSFGSKIHSISIEERFVVVGEYFFRLVMASYLNSEVLGNVGLDFHLNIE
jgi:hypothetical protein